MGALSIPQPLWLPSRKFTMPSWASVGRSLLDTLSPVLGPTGKPLLKDGKPAVSEDPCICCDSVTPVCCTGAPAHSLPDAFITVNGSVSPDADCDCFVGTNACNVLNGTFSVPHSSQCGWSLVISDYATHCGSLCFFAAGVGIQVNGSGNIIVISANVRLGTSGIGGGTQMGWAGLWQDATGFPCENGVDYTFTPSEIVANGFTFSRVCNLDFFSEPVPTCVLTTKPTMRVVIGP